MSHLVLYKKSEQRVQSKYEANTRVKTTKMAASTTCRFVESIVMVVLNKQEYVFLDT